MSKPDIRFCDLPVGRHFEFSNSETFSSICKKTSPICYTWQDGDGRELSSRVTKPVHVWVRPVMAYAPALKLRKRPVAFRVKAPEGAGWSWLYYTDEQKAAESANNLGVDYDGLYVRDGTPLTT